MIYGAGQAGRQLAQAMAHSHEKQVVAFLDDDDRLHGHVLNGLPIHNQRSKLMHGGFKVEVQKVQHDAA